MKKFNLTATDIKGAPAGIYEDIFECQGKMTRSGCGVQIGYAADWDQTGNMIDSATGRVIGFGALELISNRMVGDARVVLYQFGGRLVAETNGDPVEIGLHNLDEAAELLRISRDEMAEIINAN